jgi:hypothetical protein
MRFTLLRLTRRASDSHGTKKSSARALQAVCRIITPHRRQFVSPKLSCSLRESWSPYLAACKEGRTGFQPVSEIKKMGFGCRSKATTASPFKKWKLTGKQMTSGDARSERRPGKSRLRQD